MFPLSIVFRACYSVRFCILANYITGSLLQYTKPASVGVFRFLPCDPSSSERLLPGRHNDHCRLVDHEAWHSNQPDSKRLH